MTAAEERLLWRIIPIAIIIGAMLGLLTADIVWLPVH